jgi:polyisoprenyl-phosphate glycosyltransferase
MRVLPPDSPSRLKRVSGGRRTLAIVIPVFNDWICAAKLLPLLDTALADTAADIHVILIDDGSNRPAPPDLFSSPLRAICDVRVLRLRRNLGHQRAIAIGLYYVHKNMTADATVIMDGDGEDRPSDIPALLACLDQNGGHDIVFAARTKRLEEPAFRFFYHVYRLIHRVLTGISVRVGNFSVIPRDSVERLMASSDLWNHYAAAAYRSKLPLRSVPLPRGTRLNGRSRMNFYALVVHGLSAISVFADVVSVRLLVGATGFVLLALTMMAGVAYTRFAMPHAIPGWVALATGLLAVICLQAMMLSLVLVLPVIGARSNTSFIPLRDSEYYILEQKGLWKDEPDGIPRRRIGAV